MSIERGSNVVLEAREDGSRRLRVVCDGGRTKQEFKKECDINVIMARFQKTGAISHYARYAPTYGFAPAVTFQEATETVRRAQEMFDDLPSALRKRFDNDPARFLEFVQDEANGEEMIKLGLREPRPAERLPATAEEIAAAIAGAAGPASPAEGPVVT